MYNIKEKDDNDRKRSLRYNCISGRAYFEKTANCNMINIKTTYIPIDNIFY
ncbi:hypothetical protein ACFIJ5_09760 [Haloimpatiens sp. FM7330]|uniref:hypothetical protein n=1 Tax=Haloimpatiens sp. FM7330 TaxID=3298610 RepID=UPI003644D44E